jgi:hypothetical protein
LADLERISGLAFPQDYKELTARYGRLEVDAFLAVNHLGMPAEVPAMLRQCQETLEGLRILVEDLGFIYVEDDLGREVEAEPYPFYPNPGGLFPWGRRRTETLYYGELILIQIAGQSSSPMAAHGGISTAASTATSATSSLPSSPGP